MSTQADNRFYRTRADYDEAEQTMKDAARYREFFKHGLPVTFMGIEYSSKTDCDAAIDAAIAADDAAKEQP